MGIAARGAISLGGNVTLGSERVERTAHAASSSIEDVRVDHHSLHAGVAEELLDGADVVPVLQKVGGEGVAERVGARALGDARAPAGGDDGTLDRGLVQTGLEDRACAASREE